MSLLAEGVLILIDFQYCNGVVGLCDFADLGRKLGCVWRNEQVE